MMSTTAANPRAFSNPATVLPGRRFDHIFFSVTALMMAATVYVGFAPTYYMAGIFRAPLPSTIIHIHGAAFTGWILLLITQTSLASAGRVDIHRRLGLLGFCLASVMVVLGVLAATDRLARASAPPGSDPYFFYIIPLGDMIIFATLIFFAYRSRSNPAAHKRIIYVATVGLLIAAIARWPISLVHRKAPNAAIASYIFLLLLVAYDLWSTRRIHRATLWASGFLIFIQQIRLPIGRTAAWHSFAAWLQSIAR
jgi:FtsH-binding integral membrane protein